MKHNIIIKYLNGLLHYYKVTADKAKLLHHKIKSINTLHLQELTFINPYQAVFDWVLDVLQYGMLMFIVYYSFTTYRSPITMTISFGIVHWLTFDILKEIKQIIKNG